MVIVIGTSHFVKVTIISLHYIFVKKTNVHKTNNSELVFNLTFTFDLKFGKLHVLETFKCSNLLLSTRIYSFI